MSSLLLEMQLLFNKSTTPLKQEKYKAMIEYTSTTDSTQEMAKRHILANRALQEMSFFVAEEQTGGRGKGANFWLSPMGNFYCSIVTHKRSIINSDILSLTTAIAVSRSFNIADIAQYKWPNDIIINNGKVGGILIEIFKEYTIIGIGVNLTVSPEITNYKTNNLKNLGLLQFTPSPETIIDTAVKTGGYIANIDAMDKNDILSTWTKHAYGLQKRISAKQNNIIHQGIFVGLGPNGEMMLKKKDQTLIKVVSPFDCVF